MAEKEKKKAKKSSLLRKVLIAILVVFLLISVLFSFFGERAATVAAEKAGTKALGVGVDIDAITFSLMGGEGKINGLTVDNPEGYKLDYAMKMGQGDIAVDTGSLLSDEVRIKKLHFDGLHINFESRGFKSNFQTITENIKPAEGEKKPEEEKPAEKGKKQVVVDKLIISNAKVTVKLIDLPVGDMDKMTFTLPRIELEDVGKDKKLTFAELSKIIFGTITETIMEAGKGIIPSGVLDSLGGTFKGAAGMLGDLGQGVFGSVSGIAGEGGKKLGEAAEGGKKAVEGVVEGGKKAIEGAAKTGENIGKEAGKIVEGIGGMFGGEKKEEEKAE
ncbi:DUF748 domain-containing protein [Sedimentisphaera salicampi]|uniref:DUF748 domain-containing protein n=1 Tax=Sedimentisphaera salicampi TaxID=1941349 RepID=UPI000B9C31CE|nr:hypothetical protein [Sedimentisphaera salicampi]OXU15297.1 putative protein involved in outer membrane biogenesis [Sedimentisphaera salicampi]